MHLTKLDETTKGFLADAEKRFRKGRENLTDAFNNEALSTLERVTAIRYRVMAAILESVVETLRSSSDLSSLSLKLALERSLPECEECLQTLNSLPDVKNNFKVELEKGLLNIKGWFGKDERREIISTVCQVNRTMYDTFKMACKDAHVWIWPSFDTGKDQIDPLRDIRVAEVLRKVDMRPCLVRPLSFGQEGEMDHTLKSPNGIATNACGQVIIGELKGGTVKVFNIGGSFHLSFNARPDDSDLKFPVFIYDVATDVNENIYVLVLAVELGFVVRVYTKAADLLHKFSLITSGFCLRLAVSNSKVFVLSLTESETGGVRFVIDVYDYADGSYVRAIEDDELGHAVDITATSDGHVIVLNLDNRVFVFTEDGQQQCKFSIDTQPVSFCRLISCDPTNEHVVVAGRTPFAGVNGYLSALIYTKDGKFERSIILDQSVEGPEDTGLRGVTVSKQGHIVLAIKDEYGKGKVIVL